MLRYLFLPIFILLALLSCNSNEKKVEDEMEVSSDQWISLFNGKDLNDWKVKISKHELGDNYANTFKVENGLLKVRYEGYEDFDKKYGHIFYDKPFSNYLLHIEYRFVGEQAPGGEDWAIRNSGAMLHSQAPETMGKGQDFPISIEGQLLGGNGVEERTTSNLCTPGTHVVMDGELFTPHCVSSHSKTFHGEQWVSADFLVLGNSVIHHIVEGDTVLTYYKPQIGGGNVHDYDENVKKDGRPLKQGYISLQSESHPIDFRQVEVFDLNPYIQNQKQLNTILEKLRVRK
ncbi:DUF1080 domain-containing protein [Echinicola jeungdonensis]|uniref:DUF1080 domain-containing protein n=1 Tax=Echinicola jeungdonensis TaxID=709343 RepID=A0ABV5J102_9BACT|nr:DUF1080 domain-containing protein [Echinicola jeungdonensis]MDN3668321.1 DUF1080 domain-containing protein [Echinicola jeungdonensis]